MRARRDDPERGSLLVMVAVYTAVLLMLGGALLTCAMTEQLIACNQEEEMRLYYIAEAGMEAGVAALACFFDYDRPISGSVGDGSYHVRIVPPPGLPESDPHYEMIPQLILPGQRLVISEGKLRGKTMAMAAIVEAGNSLSSRALLAAGTLALEGSFIDGSVHVDEVLQLSKDNTICGKLTFFEEASLEWKQEACLIIQRPGEPPLYFYREDALPAEIKTAQKMGLPPLNTDAFSDEVEFSLLSGQIWSTYPCAPFRRVEVRGSLAISPGEGETFSFNFPDGLLVVRGDLAVRGEGAVNLTGTIVVEGDIEIDSPVTGSAESQETSGLLLCARGNIHVGEGALEGLTGDTLMSGPLLLFAEQGWVSIDASTLREWGRQLHIHGVIVASSVHLVNCRLHHDPSVTGSFMDKFGIERVVVKEWIKPWRPQ